jgi:hypothetical protein
MSDSTTRISELPENITYQVGNPQIMGNIAQLSTPQNSGSADIGQNTYVPLNIHPNPYGTPQTGDLPPPQSIQPRNRDTNIPGDQYDIPPQRLPSRDIPMNTLDYQNDEEIHANYVPKVKLTSDYIREYEKASEESLRKHERETYREQTAKSIWNDIQIPVLIAILYFIFQMPVVTKFLYKYFSFLSIYRDDGNMNLVGLLLKSVLFGSLFLLIQKTTDFLVSL